jgi:hypothetical protein
MPPPNVPRPDAGSYDAVATWLETEIDRAWATAPNPGRTGAIHRLNRFEYNNAVEDLFGLDLDVQSLLPGDETADGSFDNFADVLTISTAHLERYLSVARQVTRLAVGLPPAVPAMQLLTVRDTAARGPGRTSERELALWITRRHRDPLQRPGRR